MRARSWRGLWRDGITTQRLTIRALREGDFPAWRAGYAGRLAPAHAFDTGPVAPAELEPAVFERFRLVQLRQAEADRAYVLFAFLTATGENVGAFDLSTLARGATQWAGIGYFVHNQFQRRGFGREALSAVLRAGWTFLGYHRIEAAIDPENRPSIALVSSAGMAFECRRRQFWRDGNHWLDQDIYSVTANT